jgi:rhamnopyranosyl-N-acetylglucosaminyl-diphospho-decaprenol beta-1,3/1,4-galactofuranosyltransferase
VGVLTLLETHTQTMNTERSPKVAAVFATMNRAATAVACVKALAAQTRPPELVVVADNVSTDETFAVLEAMTSLPFELVVHQMSENRGNAGGVQEAMDLAFARKVDFVWILDDDSIPRVDALHAILSMDLAASVVRHAIQVDPQCGRLTWPMWLRQNNDWRLTEELGDFIGRESVETRASWTGSMISREIRDAVGPVNGDLFIRGEDEEYPWRISQAGFSFSAITGAVLDHAGPQHLRKIRLLGKHLFYEEGLSDWKLYYKVRNMVWLQRRARGRLHAIVMALAYAFIGVKVDGFSRVPLLWEAICDGWSERLGKWKKHL